MGADRYSDESFTFLPSLDKEQCLSQLVETIGTFFCRYDSIDFRGIYSNHFPEVEFPRHSFGNPSVADETISEEKSGPESKSDFSCSNDFQKSILQEIENLISKSDFDVQAPFNEIGLDSFKIINLAKYIRKEHGLKVSAADFFKYPNPNAIVNYLESQRDSDLES